jgi:hypothetical protein
LLRFGIKSGAHGGDKTVPAGLFFAEAFAAGGGEFVVFGATVVVGGAPTGFQKALTDEAKERGVEGSLFDKKRAARDLLDAEENAVAVEGAEGDGFKNEQVESTGEKVGLRGHGAS